MMNMSSTKPDVVLIDDDSLIRIIWETEARFYKHVCYCFSNLESFINHNIDKDVPVFMDYRWGDEPAGLRMASYVLREGYRNVYITTGCEPEDVNAPPQIQGIVGKEYPLEILNGGNNVVHIKTRQTAPVEPAAVSALDSLAKTSENSSEALIQLTHDLKSVVNIAKTIVRLTRDGAASSEIQRDALQELIERENRIEQQLNHIRSQVSNLIS